MRIENLAGKPHELSDSPPKPLKSPKSPPSETGYSDHQLPKIPLKPTDPSSETSKLNKKFVQSQNSSALIITDIKQGVKNPNRANIFINNKFSFSLDITQIVDLKVKLGQTLSEDRLAELKKASEFGKLYQRTLEWVLLRPRSIRETKDYLRKKIYDKKLDPSFSETIVARLLEKNYLNDQKFAEYYIENRFVKKGISKKRLRLELFKKGIENDLIDAALETSDRSETDEARKIIQKKRRKYDDEKLIAYLCRQGFSYQLAKDLVAESSNPELDSNPNSNLDP